MNNELVFTMDFEDWTHSENISPYVKYKKNSHSSLYAIDEVLKFLNDRSVKGTFFFLGALAEKNKSLVRDLFESGHEIANHGWNHDLLSGLTEKETQQDVVKSTHVLQDIIGDKVVGYRSPCFSQNPFIGKILVNEGYLYTSMGISSSFHDRYASNYFINGGIPDFGLPVAKIGSFEIPCTGGGWFRLLPTKLQIWLLKKSKEDPKIFYCHPWDFDASQPSLQEIPRLVRWRHSVNVDKAMQKLNSLNFGSEPLKNYV